MVTDLIFQHAIFPCQERVSTCLSFIHHLKIHRRQEPPSLFLSLSLLSSVHVSVRHWSLVGCRLSAWHIVQKHHLPLSSSSMALTLAYGWHGTSWMCAAFCCPENRLILAQTRSPFTALPPPRCPGVNWHHSTRHQTARQRPRAPAWAAILERILPVIGLCFLLLLHSMHCIFSGWAIWQDYIKYIRIFLFPLEQDNSFSYCFY